MTTLLAAIVVVIQSTGICVVDAQPRRMALGVVRGVHNKVEANSICIENLDPEVVVVQTACAADKGTKCPGGFRISQGERLAYQGRSTVEICVWTQNGGVGRVRWATRCEDLDTTRSEK